ncbi:MAG: hypothetical protein GY853_10745 [PVC group bacterium]|nr:hypothetical protein [PVC group bacterium]
MCKRTIYSSIFIVLVFLISVFSLIRFVFFSTRGSAFITRTVLALYVESKDITIGQIEGNLVEGLSFHDIEIKALKKLPKNSVIKMQRLEAAYTGGGYAGIVVDIYNGKFLLPGSEPILFYGKYEYGMLDMSVYSKHVAIREIFDLFVDNITLKNISGDVSDLDINIKGSFLAPELSGSLKVEELSRRGFYLRDCPIKLVLSLKDLKNNIKLNGTVVLKGGIVSARRTSIQLGESRIVFTGDPKLPTFTCKGKSVIESIKINIVFKGTLVEPDLTLSSDPTLNKEILLVMLATGKRWRSAETVMSHGDVSADIVRDFVDYFLLAGSGAKLAERFGLRDISFTVDTTKRGVEVTQGVSSRTEVSYGIEQSQLEEEETPVTTHSVGVGYNINADETVSLEAERAIKQDQALDSEEKLEKDDKVMLKFKKQF